MKILENMKHWFNNIGRKKSKKEAPEPKPLMPRAGKGTETGVFYIHSPATFEVSPYSSDPADKLRLAYKNFDKVINSHE